LLYANYYYLADKSDSRQLWNRKSNAAWKISLLAQEDLNRLSVEEALGELSGRRPGKSHELLFWAGLLPVVRRPRWGLATRTDSCCL